MADVSVLESLLILIAVIGICDLKIINNTLLDRRFHFWLVLHDGSQGKLQADLRLHPLAEPEVGDVLSLRRVQELDRQWRLPVRHQKVVEVYFRFPGLLLAELQLLLIGMRLPLCLTKFIRTGHLVGLTMLLIVAIALITIVELELKNLNCPLWVLSQSIVEAFTY